MLNVCYQRGPDAATKGQGDRILASGYFKDVLRSEEGSNYRLNFPAGYMGEPEFAIIIVG